MLEGINYLHAKFQINILKKQKVIKTFRTLNTLEKKRNKIQRSKKVVRRNKSAVELLLVQNSSLVLNTTS